ncbi:Acetyl esterase Axe7A precursor [Limihaloglobus sulfuriphilus]|uniref:Acetyl esterase Axe7A n=1 Tax=Limihaloglobus sulfuriphilus TaxID=1851148 RepID=A0A1Q2MIF7_9BACT|nr:acetylxylan esterase [Limihaloglobus sulfuriphilus]AQQ72495.1 Acetyl esterase Axe7A precursor [Limihaloglobus sulfuriphilus]
MNKLLLILLGLTQSASTHRRRGIIGLWLILGLNLSLIIITSTARDTRPPSDYVLTIETDRPKAFYQQGERVGFNISLTRKGQPVNSAKIHLRISKDGITPNIHEEDIVITNGKAFTSAVLSEPGFLNGRVDFRVPEENRILSSFAAAAVDPLKIGPSMPPPDDFDEFWASQKERLADSKINLKMTLVDSAYSDLEIYDVQADCFDGIHLSAYLAKPVGAKPASLPATVLCHGAGVASSRMSSVAGWAREGFVAIDFNAHGLPNGQPRSFYTNLYKNELKRYYMRGAKSRETLFFRELFIRLMRATDIVASQPEWDGKILVANGRSQGGGQAIAAAGLDSRVTFIAAQIPALCDHTGIAAGRINGWPKLIPVDANGKPDSDVMKAVRYYDAMNFATRTKADAFFTVGFIDRSCPPTGVYAAYNQLSGDKNIMNHLHTGHVTSEDADKAVRIAVLKHVRQMRNK